MHQHDGNRFDFAFGDNGIGERPHLRLVKLLDFHLHQDTRASLFIDEGEVDPAGLPPPALH